MLLDGFEPSFLPYHGSVLPLHTMGAIILLLNILMEHCYYKTSLDTTNMYDKNWKYTTSKSWDIQMNIVPITDYFIKYLESYGLIFDCTLLFHTKLSVAYSAHVDLYGTGELSSPGLNYVIDGKDGIMMWYDTPSSFSNTRKTPAGTDFRKYLIKDLELIESYSIKDELVLVRTDIPHAVVSCNEPRTCISVRLKPQKHIPWNCYVEMFSSKGLLIAR